VETAKAARADEATGVPIAAVGHDAGPALSGKPDGGGLRGAFAGLAALRVPRPRSVFATAGSLTVLLVGSGVLLVGLDGVLADRLAVGGSGHRGVLGVLGLCAGTLALVLLFPVALDAPTQPRALVERRPGRLAAGLAALAVSALCALLWARGLVVV